MASPSVPTTAGLTQEQWNLILLALQLSLATAQAAGADPTLIGYIQTAVDAAIAGVQAVKQAQSGVDPNALKPITPAV